jgi:hypothetical protein
MDLRFLIPRFFLHLKLLFFNINLLDILFLVQFLNSYLNVLLLRGEVCLIGFMLHFCEITGPFYEGICHFEKRIKMFRSERKHKK